MRDSNASVVAAPDPDVPLASLLTKEQQADVLAFGAPVHVAEPRLNASALQVCRVECADALRVYDT